MPNVAPRLFIGSSTESRDVAAAIQTKLDPDAEVTRWDQNIFAPSLGTLETLESKLSSFDFAVFVLAPDDIVKFRGDQTSVTRDNVIFETGLFMGKLGRRNVFMIRPRGSDLRLPTDLSSITTLEYNPNRSDRNWVAALGHACNIIRETLQRWSPRSAGNPDINPSNLAINPHYNSDLALLDGNFDLRTVINPKTIFLITSDGIVSELLDRQSAAFLRDRIDSEKGNRAITVSDSKWISDLTIRPNPAISIGSENANQATKVIQAMVGSNWENPKGCYGKFAGRGNCPLVALWGYSALTTRQTVEAYIDNPLGLTVFLKICG
jgi:predicted nucleotide-binding protein with TIR-like domain